MEIEERNETDAKRTEEELSEEYVDAEEEYEEDLLQLRRSVRTKKLPSR